MSTLHAIDSIVKNPVLHDYLAILKGARSGFVQAVQIRFPHSLVAAILFGRGGLKQRARFIYNATKQHSLNLAKGVALYKTILLIQKKIHGGKERNADTFIAGVIAGHLSFGSRDPVNEQLMLYVLSRIIAAFLPRAASAYLTNQNSGGLAKPIPPDSRYFSMFAALAWGAIMWRFQVQGQTLQPGLFSSMVYLYRDSDQWKNLKTLLWHNA